MLDILPMTGMYYTPFLTVHGSYTLRVSHNLTVYAVPPLPHPVRTFQKECLGGGGGGGGGIAVKQASNYWCFFSRTDFQELIFFMSSVPFDFST